MIGKDQTLYLFNLGSLWASQVMRPVYEVI